MADYTELYDYAIFYEGELQASFKGETNDQKAFGYLLDHQGQSTDYALKYGGWKVEITEQSTGRVEDYLTCKLIRYDDTEMLYDRAYRENPPQTWKA